MAERRAARSVPLVRWGLYALICLVAALVFIRFRQDIFDAILAANALEGWTLAGALAVLAVYFLISQLVIIPSGTLSLILAGVAFGPVTGLIYYAAMLLACPPVHAFGRLHPERADAFLERHVRSDNQRARVRRILSRVRAAPIALTAALRLVPVLPSAGSALLAGAAGISMKAALTGTLAAGWIRPVAIALAGDQIWRLMREADAGLSILRASPLLWITLGCLAGSAGLVWLISRKALGTDETRSPEV
ncbi:MAG: VTT domain-containing protein [Caulobacterales bacterium]|uniref:VTT domain-containing protein n=1 Tax=Glycocaulis sp. TaxID=1969725 RepID=UPI003FA1061B